MKKDLWIRLKGYRFQNLVPVSMSDRIIEAFGGTDAFTRAFAAKLARKLGWSNEFAYLAIREYKKFVFLGVTSRYEVTPSKIIDQVWHEHQLFTQGYREFCRNVLKRNFDHAPELLPFDEQTDVFNAQYRKTLALYEREFGVKPPHEIWGNPKFDPDTVTTPDAKPRKKNKKDESSSSSSDGDTPLFALFAGGDTNAPIPVNFTGNGGSMGGAGADGSWSTPAAPADHGASAPDSGGSATSCSSSSCGSSCGGGGCGG